LAVRGAASQATNLQEWQNSAGNILARLSATGGLISVNINTTLNYVGIKESQSGGEIYMTRKTASVTNPGANTGTLYFRDGTVAGTLKLVVRAGTAGAETTILDNIPQ
jgi:hypothetical protein